VADRYRHGMATSSQLRTGTLLPVLVLAGGVAVFSAMDAVMKGLSIAIGAYNAVFWRLLIALPISAIVYIGSRPTRPTAAAMRLHVTRGVVSSASAFTFFWGLALMPLAEGVALSFVAPVIALYLAALLLGETVQRRAIIAALLCSAGVLCIVWSQLGRDGGSASLWGAASILIAAALYAYNLVLLRQQAQIAGPQEVAFFQNLATVGALGVFAPFFAVVPPGDQLAPLTIAAVLTIAASLIFAWSYRRAETQQLATLEYTALIWAALFGYWMFGERISLATIIGSALIIGGCTIAARPARQALSPAEASV
jgi:S-adenosylmethionine uptake transporter